MGSTSNLLTTFAIGLGLAWGWPEQVSELTDSVPKQADRQSEVAVVRALNKFGASKVAAQAAVIEYQIGSGDVLAIDVWKQPDGSVSATTVRPDGKISLPFINEVQVAGLTPRALEALLTERLSEYFRDPRITVTVKEVNSQKIYVIGEVKKEGAIRLISPMTVLQALAEAGGITDYAKSSRIRIFRIEDGKQKIYGFDYRAVVRGQHVEQNFQVLPGDTIVVPR